MLSAMSKAKDDAAGSARSSTRDKEALPNNLGTYVAQRMVQHGVSDFFSVPGDYNLVLLDQLLAVPELRMIGCCNELNAGYAADGYARTHGLAVVVVTFTVGGLSVINAIAGAFSDSIPVIVLSGGPNSNDFGTERVLHHTIGSPYFGQQHQCYKQVRTHPPAHPSRRHCRAAVEC